jgi:type I restriction enzyme, S subunit
VRGALASLPDSIRQFRNAVLTAAFCGDLTAAWRASHLADEPAQELVGREHPRPNGDSRRRTISKEHGVYLDETLFGSLPKSWTYATVDDLLRANVLLEMVDGNHGSLYPRKEQFAAEGAVFITAKQIHDGDVDFQSAPRLKWEVARSLSKGWARGGDVLLTHNATVGRAARVSDGVSPFLLGTSVTFYRPNPAVLSPDYLFYVFLSPQWQRQLQSVMQQTTRDQVSIQKQAFFRVPVAPPAEQQRIAELLERTLGWLRSVERAVVSASSQVDEIERSALAKAFRGELVAQNPNEEPASRLLERLEDTGGRLVTPNGSIRE